MVKERLVIFLFLLTLGSGKLLLGQTVDSAFTLPQSFHPVSPWVVNPFPKIPKPIGWSGDTLYHPIGLLDENYGVRKVTVSIDKDWSYITFTETLDGEIIRIPFTAPVDWYFMKKKLSKFYGYSELIHLPYVVYNAILFATQQLVRKI